MSYREGRFWQPDVTVATVVVRDGKLLCVEERANGALVINQPAGHLEPDESLIEAAVRETREETGWNVRVTHLVGAYQWKAETGRHYLRFAFGGRVGEEVPGFELDDGIVRAVWMSPEEIRATADRHRSPLIVQCVDDWLAGRRYDLDLLRHYD